MKLLNAIFLIFGIFLLGNAQLGHGDRANRARNDHSGNLIRVTFHNHGMLGAIRGDNSLVYGGEWPINSGLVQMGNTSSYVGTRLRVYAGLDTLSGDSTYAFITPIAFCQGWDPNVFSFDENGKFLGFEPLPGYLSLVQKAKDNLHAVAMSHEAFTWPPIWPDKMDDPLDPGWAGAWNGYFGKDQKNADQESFYVVDDYQFTKKISGFDIPKPIASEPDRGGLGLQQFIRGLQWSNPDAEDCIFYIYDIKNIGELSLSQTVFGLNVGASIGAKLGLNTDYDDDCATFYREIDLTVNYDWDNVGTQGYSPVPWVGFAFLESPGNPFDGIDNDGDGADAAGGGKVISTDDFVHFYNVGDEIVLINYNNYERTVSTMPANGVTITVNGETYKKLPNAPLEEIDRNGIDDNLNGIIDESDGAVAPDSVAYYLYIKDPVYNNQDYLAVDYFTGNGTTNLMIDERRDDGIDNDGDWDPDIDDVGLDGKSGTGDLGEGDGMPTPAQDGLPGEPNIDKTDVSESDQIGLTSFVFYEYGTITYSNDDAMWTVSRPGFFDGHLENVDADYIFSCGYFPLLPEKSEFFSLAMIYGWDEPDIIRNKNVVQKIYDSNYNFAVAPDLPTLSVVPGDGKVTLYWDDKSEFSWDRFLREYDFSGYKIYRSTWPTFEDEGVITDGFGYGRYSVPIAVYDKVDSVFGFFPETFGRGVQFYLGSETGLTHTYVDSPLVNGLRYFYAVTAFDRGSIDANIGPSETSKTAQVSPSGEIKLGINVVEATPSASASDYVAPGFDEEPTIVGSAITEGRVWANFLEPDSLYDGDEFEIRFLDHTMDGRDNDLDSLVDGNDPDELIPDVTTGLVMTNMTKGVEYDTVWFKEYVVEDDSAILIRDLYETKDGNPNTLNFIQNGIEFFIYNPPAGLINDPEKNIFNGIRWSNNIQYESAYNLRFGRFQMGGFLPGVYYPRQYQVIFFDEIIGKSDYVYPVLAGSGTSIPVPPMDVNFKVIDMATGEEVPFGFVDQTTDPSIVGPGFFSAKDRIIFFEELANGDEAITYNLLNNDIRDTQFFDNYGRHLGFGDTISVIPDFPFTGDTRFSFTTRGSRLDANQGKQNLDQIRVVPNPYVVAASWDPRNLYTAGKGDQKIEFQNVPAKCTIRIFSVDGTLINTLEHNDPSGKNGTVAWDLLTKDRLELAYGVYIYHIKAPGIGEKVGRFIIIK